jgi:predicted RNase H-like HicB family nuclease
MQYQIFVQSQSEKHFLASVMGMPSIAVDGNTEAEAIANAKIALESQLATGKIVTISIESTPSSINLTANSGQSSQVVRDWQILSESSLAEVWLNEDEDKAWLDL